MARPAHQDRRSKRAAAAVKRGDARGAPGPVLAPEQVDRSILVIRGQKVLLDSQLAGFYGVPTKVLMQAVKRNAQRFPEDFMFQITRDEWDILRSQFVTSSLRSQIVILEPSTAVRPQIAASKSSGRGGRRYTPYAFTEQGVAMLSGVLRSPRAVAMNIQIMRAFVRLRQLLAAHRELADRLTKLEAQMRDTDAHVRQQFQEIFALLDQLFNPPSPPRKPIGFHTERSAG